MKSIKILAPATVANIVCGFDILGLALNHPQDEMEMRCIDKPIITIHHTDDFNLPLVPEQNVAGAALLALINEYPNKNIGFELIINKIIKPGSGLGSSAASSAGAVAGANYLLNNYFGKTDLIRFAMNGEKVASGVKHADNIAPCIYGGVTLVRSTSNLDIIPLTAPPMYVTVVHPQIEVKTSDARQILRKEVLLKDAIQQWGNIAGLVAGFLQNDYELISRSLEDVIIEPIRSILIPGFDEIKKQCKEVGVIGGGISGSGPSVFMFSKDETTANLAEQIMKAIYNKIGINYYTYVTTINKDGVKITDC
ncbi:MAG: homoserine kinase [Chitinophagaceae bacterium]|nr:homoserine kinase [Chitinophagaceae bacterium]